MDALYPGINKHFSNFNLGSIPMSRVDFGGNQDYQYVNNYKLLQRAFDKNGIDRVFYIIIKIKNRYILTSISK